MSERVKGISSNNNKVRDTIKPTASFITAADPGKPNDQYTLPFYKTCKAASPYSPSVTSRTLTRRDTTGSPATRRASRYNHVMPPNSWSCGYGGNNGGGSFAPSSRHSGVANVLFCDGRIAHEGLGLHQHLVGYW